MKFIDSKISKLSQAIVMLTQLSDAAKALMINWPQLATETAVVTSNMTVISK